MCSHISLSRLHIGKGLSRGFLHRGKKKKSWMSSSSRKAIQTGDLPKGILWLPASTLQWRNVMWRDFLCSSEILLKVRKLSILPTHRGWHSQIYCGSGIHDTSFEFTLDDKESRNMIMKSSYINISLFCTFSLHCPLPKKHK